MCFKNILQRNRQEDTQGGERAPKAQSAMKISIKKRNDHIEQKAEKPKILVVT